MVGDQRIELMHSGEMKTTAAPFVGAKVRQTFKGAKSPTRLPGGEVVFELFLAGNVRPEEVISLAIPELRKNERRVEIGRSSGYMVVSSSEGRKTLVPLKFDRTGNAQVPGMSGAYYRLTPESKLVTGEYVLIVNHRFLDFGVDGH